MINNIPIDNVYNRIRYIYDNSKLTQREFALKAEITISYISKIINDKLTSKRPPKKLLRRLSRNFGVNYQWLETGAGQIYAENDTGGPLAGSADFSSLHGLPEAMDLAKDILAVYNDASEDERDRLFGAVARIRKRIEREREAGAAGTGSRLDAGPGGEKKEAERQRKSA